MYIIIMKASSMITLCFGRSQYTRYIDMYGCYIIKKLNTLQYWTTTTSQLHNVDIWLTIRQRSQFVNCSMHTVIAHYVLYYTCRHIIIAGEYQLYMYAYKHRSFIYNDHGNISIIAYSVARQVTKYKLLCPRSTIANKLYHTMLHI